MQPMPLVSIIIDNYNYGRFLKSAIDSALCQTYPDIEVLVVDDGSTDNSHEIIAIYEDRIISILKLNGGQASAFNAGFARCRGSIVIFLDSDDMLLPNTVQRVVAAFQAHTEAAKVFYRMEVIGATGVRTGMFVPPMHRPLPNGDIRAHILAFPDDIPWPATSGNAFAASVLQQIFPIPEEPFRLCADYYLSNLSSLFGPVIPLSEVGAYYRVHGMNNHNSTILSLNQIRLVITRTYHTHYYLKKFSDSLGLSGLPDQAVDVLSVTFFAHRMISLKLEPLQHPLQADTLLGVLLYGVAASLNRFDRSLTMKGCYILWFVAMALSPKLLAQWLAKKFLFPRNQGQFSKLLGAFRIGKKSISDVSV